MLKRLIGAFLVSLFITAISFAATINVKLLNQDMSPAAGVNLWCLAFLDGEDELNAANSQMGTTATDGTYSFSGLKALDQATGRKVGYKIAFVKHKIYPTIKEQIVMAGIPKFYFPDDSGTANLNNPGIILFTPPNTMTSGVLTIKISTSSIPAGGMFVAEILHKTSGEPVAFGIGKDTGTASSFFKFNVVNIPVAPANTYKLVVTKMGTNEGAEVIISTDVADRASTAGAPEIPVEFGFVSTSRSEEEIIVNASDIAFEGFVIEKLSQNPIPNCSVEIRDAQPDQTHFNNFAKTVTDGSGKFVILKNFIAPAVDNRGYAVNISQLGYKSEMDYNQLAIGQPGYVYKGSRIILPKYQLEVATGVIKGRVTLNNGVGIPDIEVALETEWDRMWKGPYADTDTFKPMDGGGFYRTFTKGDGSYEFAGVAAGTYNLRANSPILRQNEKYYHPPMGGQQGGAKNTWDYNYIYNYGTDQKSSSTFTGFREMDDRRVIITSDTIKSRVYDASGAMRVGDNDNINIDLMVTITTNAVITGTLKFPITTNPDITKLRIVAHPIDPQTRQWTEWQGQGMAYYATSNDITPSAGAAAFLINVTTGTYFVEIRSEEWVPAKMYNAEVTLKEPGSSWQLPEISMVKAGRLEGKVKLPNGSYFQATEGQGYSEQASIDLRGMDVDFGGHVEINNWNGDPTRFMFDAVPAGKYSVWVEVRRMSFGQGGPGSGQSLYPLTIVSNVRVYAGQTTSVEAQIKEGVLCEPIAPLPPQRPEVDYTSRSAVGTGFYGIVGFPSDLSLKGSLLQALLQNQGMLDDIHVQMLNFDPIAKSWQPQRLLTGKYNFYMIFLRMFGSDAGFGSNGNGGPAQNNPDEYMTIISRAENVEIKADDLASGATFQIRMGAGTVGSGVLAGRMRGTKFLSAEDGGKIKGNLSEFLNYMPTVMLYDMDGNIKAYSAARPSNSIIELAKWGIAVGGGNAVFINNMINSDIAPVSSPVHYYIDGIPLGKYVMVCETKNYPPVTRVVTVSTGTTTIDVDFDKEAAAGAGISGTVTNQSGGALAEANVVLSHRLVTKKVLTDSTGQFSVNGLPSGTYRIDITKPGYATSGDKVSLGIEDKTIAVTLKTAGAAISGKIYVRESAWSRKSVYTGAKVVAYNETENVLNSGKYLPALTTKTENDGSYKIPDIILNNTYYLYAFVPERPVYYKRVYISSAVMDSINFDIQPSTPTLKVIMKRTENPYVFRFIIESPRPLVSVPECYYSPGAVFDSTKKIRALPTQGAKKTYTLDVEIPENGDDEYYTLQIRGQYGMSEYMTEELNFSQKFLAKAKKEVADELAEGGSILIDDERADNTEVKLDPGTLASEELVDAPIGGFLSALPSFRMSKTGRNISLLIDSAMSGVSASDVYEISLDKAQVNKAFDVTLNYDRKKVDDNELEDLKVYRYDDNTGKWDAISGVVTVDPLTGTVAVETDQLASTSAQVKAPKSTVKDGVFVINKAASTTQTGAFAVFKQDPNTAKTYTGSEFNIIGFPNPFDLKSKAVTLQDVNADQSQTVNGIMLKYSLPAAKSGKLKLCIYNLAGELVRELDEGSKTGGYFFYTEWDGKNDSNEECASGVYFLIAKLDGAKLNAKPLKIAILK